MNVQKIISKLSSEYPGKNIFKNDNQNPSEIICEVEPTMNHADHSIAVAVIDNSISHYHNKTTEIYEILDGQLLVTVDQKEIKLQKGDKLTINPQSVHSAKGNETFVKVYSKPGWTFEDHILVQK